ncbi:MAG: hypothetical protein R3F14_09375 [Polyangiaceae bacterium]
MEISSTLDRLHHLGGETEDPRREVQARDRLGRRQMRDLLQQESAQAAPGPVSEHLDFLEHVEPLAGERAVLEPLADRAVEDGALIRGAKLQVVAESAGERQPDGQLGSILLFQGPQHGAHDHVECAGAGSGQVPDQIQAQEQDLLPRLLTELRLEQARRRIAGTREHPCCQVLLERQVNERQHTSAAIQEQSRAVGDECQEILHLVPRLAERELRPGATGHLQVSLREDLQGLPAIDEAPCLIVLRGGVLLLDVNREVREIVFLGLRPQGEALMAGRERGLLLVLGLVPGLEEHLNTLLVQLASVARELLLRLVDERHQRQEQRILGEAPHAGGAADGVLQLACEAIAVARHRLAGGVPALDELIGLFVVQARHQEVAELLVGERDLRRVAEFSGGNPDGRCGISSFESLDLAGHALSGRVGADLVESVEEDDGVAEAQGRFGQGRMGALELIALTGSLREVVHDREAGGLDARLHELAQRR